MRIKGGLAASVCVSLRSRLPLGLCAIAVLAVAACGGSTPQPAPASDPMTSSETAGGSPSPANTTNATGIDLRSTVDGGCRPDVTAPPAAQITMVYKQVLFGALPDGSSLHCLSGPPISDLQGWSADGTAFAFTPGFEISVMRGGARDYSYSDKRGVFTRPQSSGVYSVAPGGDVRKHTIGQGQAATLTEGLQAFELAVSPDGMTVVAVTQTANATELWAIASDGSSRRKLVSQPAVRSGDTKSFLNIVHLVFVSANLMAYLQSPPGTGDGPYSLHVVDVSSAQNVSTGTLGSEMQLSATTGLVANSMMVAAEFGSCSTSIQTSVFDTSTAMPDAFAVPVGSSYSFAAPLGWLPDGTLVLLAKESSCDGPGDVLLWRRGSPDVQMFASGVTEAAVREPGSVFVPGKLAPPD